IIVFGFPKITTHGAFVNASVTVYNHVFIVVKTLFEKSLVSVSIRSFVIFHIRATVNRPIIKIAIKVKFLIAQVVIILKVEVHTHIFSLGILILGIHIPDYKISVYVRI